MSYNLPNLTYNNFAIYSANSILEFPLNKITFYKFAFPLYEYSYASFPSKNFFNFYLFSIEFTPGFSKLHYNS